MLILIAFLAILSVCDSGTSKLDGFQWYVQLVGDVVGFRLNSFNDLVLVGRSNVIAAISVYDGTIKWRKTFEDDCEIVKHEFIDETGDRLIFKTTAGRLICMDVKHGFIVWERGIYEIVKYYQNVRIWYDTNVVCNGSFINIINPFFPNPCAKSWRFFQEQWSSQREHRKHFLSK
ncbi:hypothetical protein ACOME3_007729 [Neoechinorhynchus agilis]